jgi:RNA polymerase sigma-70 factor (ECF subfamily)
MAQGAVTTLEEFRPLLFSIAYRMTGSAGDAEDIVQEAFLHYHRAGEGGEEIESPKAYLSTVATRLAIDHLRSARVRRESYVGPWLPEPLLVDEEADVARHAERADSLSLALLVTLERLSPVERAVFLLHEVFDYGYGEIAEIVGKSEDNCRQLAVRARRHVDEDKPRFEPSREKRDELASRFFAAVVEGDTEGLVSMLAEDVVFYGDGGGKVPAAGRPLHGPALVSKFLFGLAKQARALEIDMRPTPVNGQPGVAAFSSEDRLISVLSLDIADGRVRAIRSIANPEKLGHLGPLADVRRLIRERLR